MIDHLFQVFHVERLGDIGIRSRFQSFYLVVFVMQCREQDEGDMAPQLMLLDSGGEG